MPIRKDIGLIKELTVEVAKDKYPAFKDFIKGRGFIYMGDETELKGSIHATFDGDSMLGTWDDLEEDIQEAHPGAYANFTWGTSDDDIEQHFTFNYEHMDVVIDEDEEEQDLSWP